MKKSRILIDLTDLELWDGLHGGTQRVVYGVAKNYYLNQLDGFEVEFIAFSEEDQEFYECSFEPIYRKVENMPPLKKNNKDKGEKTQVLAAKTSSNYLKKLVPNALKSNKLVRNVASLLGAIEPASNVAPSKAIDNKVSIVFKRGDIVLVLGKPWDNLDIQRKLAALRKEKGIKVVEVVYDLIICLEPQLQNPVLIESFTEHMVTAIQSIDLVLAISQSTANDLRKFCKQRGLGIPRIEVIRLGDVIEQSVPPKKPEQVAPFLQKNFILCVGTVEIRKNHSLLYYSYKLAQEKGVVLPQLIIVGGQGWLTGDIQYMINNDPSLKNKIIMLHDINDAGMRWLYENCRFTVYPSMYEGWGLPIAESLAYGKLCIASHSSSMQEIAGDMIEYISPYSTDDLMSMIAKFSQNAVLLKQKQAVIKEHYKTTSWEDTFRYTHRLISELTIMGVDD